MLKTPLAAVPLHKGCLFYVVNSYRTNYVLLHENPPIGLGSSFSKSSKIRRGSLGIILTGVVDNGFLQVLLNDVIGWIYNNQIKVVTDQCEVCGS